MINPLVVRQNDRQIIDQTHNKFCAVDEIWRNQFRPQLSPAPTEYPTAPPIFKIGASDGAESFCKNSGQKTADDIPAEIVLKKLEKSRPLEPKSPCLPFSAVNAAQFNFLNFVAPTSPMNLCQNSWCGGQWCEPALLAVTFPVCWSPSVWWGADGKQI
jgi:hypothetical protein